jgi:hypothetical protein
MPAAAAFLSGFGLNQGSNFAGFTLISATSTHETITRYHDYSYRITLVFRGHGTYENLFWAVMDKIRDHREILSDYGNPYDCWVDYPQQGDIQQNADGSYIFHLLGHSHRVYHK